ncbi:MAG: ABC transporter substrate-binding protein [Oscillospiraceae bacterium]|jgi:polar amino acid transport system substrate-binding protein|nr:ABC transporter substrate-binding protein [Oscillospiraceae bacterium]
MNTAHCSLLKRLSALVLALACVLTFAACSASGDGKASATPSGNTPADSGAANADLTTVTPGVLKVGMEVGYPPMEYLAEDGVTITGFDYEVAGKIAEKLGLALEIVDTEWGAILTSLDSNRYDVVISSLSITESRQANYNITKAYIANNLVLVTTSGSGIASTDDLAGKLVATQTETTADDYMNELQDGGLALGDYFVYDKIIQCFDELKLGRVDAVMVDKVVALYYLQNYSELETVWESDVAEPLGMGLKKGNDALTAAIESAVDELYNDGTIAGIANKYFGSDITKNVR